MSILQHCYFIDFHEIKFCKAVKAVSYLGYSCRRESTMSFHIFILATCESWQATARMKTNTHLRAEKKKLRYVLSALLWFFIALALSLFSVRRSTRQVFLLHEGKKNIEVHWPLKKTKKNKQKPPRNWNVNKLVDLSSSCNNLIVFNLLLKHFQDCKSSHNLSGWKKRVLRAHIFHLNFKSRVDDEG